MRFLKIKLLTMLMLGSTAAIDGIVFDLGPFNLQFGGYSKAYRVAHRNALDGPICFAIQHRNQLEITLEIVETVSSKEQKIITKNLVIEPYAFGVSEDDKPILQGNVVKEELVKEVTLKYGEDQFEVEKSSSKSEWKGSFSGIFSSSKTKDLDISKILHISLIPDVHFEAPKDFKGMDSKKMDIICQLPVSK